MTYRELLADNERNLEQAALFRSGNEKALAYFHNITFKRLVHFGRRYLDDEFTVCTIVQEAILKIWEPRFREKVTTLYHAYCFVRINVRWRCLSWHSNKRNEFQKQILCDGHIERYPELFNETHSNAGYARKKEGLLQIVDKVIPLLPPTMENILRLYIDYGYSYKNIAQRYTTTNRKIIKELHKSIEQVQRIIQSGTVLNGLKREYLYKTKISLHADEIVSGVRLQIFRLRYEQKMSFAFIAEKTGLCLPAVHNEYIQAYDAVMSLKQKRASMNKSKNRWTN